MSSAKKKSAKKRTAKTKRRGSSPDTVTIAKKELLIAEKEFINIYDKDPVLQTKSRLSWLIVGIIMIIIISFWFWSLKISMKNNNNDSSDLNKITSEIDSIVGEFRALMGKTKNVIDQTNSQAEQEKEIDRIKNDVLNQIQTNLDSANWPQHSSNLLELTLKYPTNWFKKEEKNLITLASYDLKSTTTPEVSATIIITKITNSNTAIESLIENKSDYTKSQEEIFIDLLPVKKYNKNITSENNLSYLLFISKTKNIYKIEIYSNTKSIFEATINKILSTIDLL